jgi:hypothetical protein
MNTLRNQILIVRTCRYEFPASVHMSGGLDDSLKKTIVLYAISQFGYEPMKLSQTLQRVLGEGAHVYFLKR